MRALALIGVIAMNYHGYLILRGGDIGTGWVASLFDPWDGALTTRFAATFVLVAGVGITLLTRSTRADPTAVSEMRWRLARRGVLLYVVGLMLDVVWPGTILPYYGAMFAAAALVFTWRTRWIALLGIVTVIAATSLRVWQLDRELNGHDTRWLSAPGHNSLRRFVFEMFVNGTHPLLPWFGFLCAGIILGRMLGARGWRAITAGGGLILVVVSWALSEISGGDLEETALSIDPYDRGVVYVASALGSALVAYTLIDWLAERFPTATDPLRRAGQLTLSLYLAHIVVFNLLVDWLGWIEPAGLDGAVVFAVSVWVVAIVAATRWQRRYGRGPAEYVYRAFGG